MAGAWSPIDPDDIVDLFIDLGAETKPFLPADEDIATLDVTVPPEVIKVTSDFTGKVTRVRVGPCEPGRHALQYHIVTDTDQEFDATVLLTVKERVKG
jgi:hypothetical protein